jgi:hypothetical protein
MSFKRLDQEDIVISADSVTAPAWTGNTTQLVQFYTSSTQAAGTTGNYYLNVYQTASSDSTAAIQFSIAHGHKAGSGSADLNSQIDGYSPSRIIYGQYRTLINGTEETNLTFAGYTPDDIYVISVERARYKEKLLPGSLTITLKSGSNSITLTDDSTSTTAETFTDAGRVYNLVSGSAGTINTSNYTSGYPVASGSYGHLYPDAGLIVLNGQALGAPAAAGGINLQKASANTDEELPDKLYNALEAGNRFILRSEETVSSNYVFVRARNSEFNYSSNPSNITGSGELRHSVMIDSPQAYVTAVGLYNDNNDLLAIAKLSRPLLKDFTKEALVRIKLDY